MDEALCLTVGLRAVGPGELLLDAEFGTCVAERKRVEGWSVVGQDALHRDAELGEIGNRLSQEALGAVLALVRTHGGEGHSGVIIDGDEQVVIPQTARALGAVARDAVAHVREAPQLLDVDVQQITRRLALVALHGLNRGQVAESGQARSAQDATDGGLGDTQVSGDKRLREQLASQLDDGQRDVGPDGARGLGGARGLVGQPGSAIGQEACEPLAGCDRADPVCNGCIRG